MTPIQALFALLVLLCIGDIYTTTRALRLGGKEANPLMRWAIDRLGALPALLLTKGATLALLWSQIDHPWAMYALPVLCAFYAWVVAHNVEQVKRLERP